MDEITGKSRALPFGVILVDDQGTVLSYGRAEEKRDDRRLDDIVGKNFFDDVTPCDQVRGFKDSFMQAVNEEGVIARFAVRFPYPDGPRLVHVIMAGFKYAGRALCLIITGDAM